jgi:hypothetical protein
MSLSYILAIAAVKGAKKATKAQQARNAERRAVEAQNNESQGTWVG